ncbi:MAG: glycosyltransferase family 4 protein [Paludibacter sp.]|nr:glycosyltransferase family 4 protein [Paludibacter sp.]
MPLKKVLFILHIPPPVHGSSIVGKLIYDSALINNSFDCNYINLLVSRTINETGKSSSLKLFRFLIIWIQILFKVIYNRPELCYFALTVSGSAFYKDVLLVAVLKLFRIRRVYHLHNKGVSHFQQKKGYNFLYQFIFKDADVILLSKLLYADIETYVPLSRVYVCPNGIKDEGLNNYLKMPDPEKKVNILFLSNLINSKGVTVLLEACSLLRKKGIEFECNFVGAEGDIDSSQFNEKLKSLGIEGYVKYMGGKYGSAKKEYMNNADIFAFPTFYPNECFPLVLLEAMSYSLPVVSTYEGGIPDIIDDGITGFLILKNNSQLLAEKLETLISDKKLRSNLGRAGRLKYEKELTLSRFEHNLDLILHDISYK